MPHNSEVPIDLDQILALNLATAITVPLEDSIFSKMTRLGTDIFDLLQFFGLPIADMIMTVVNFIKGIFSNLNLIIFEKTVGVLFFISAVSAVLSGITTLINSLNKLQDLGKEKSLLDWITEDMFVENHQKEKEYILETLIELNKKQKLTAEEESLIKFLEKRLYKIDGSKKDRVDAIRQDKLNHYLKCAVNGAGMIIAGVAAIGLVLGGIILVSAGIIILAAIQTLSAGCVAWMYSEKLDMAQERLDKFRDEIPDKVQAIKDNTKLTPAQQENEIKKINQQAKTLENQVEKRKYKYEKYETLALASAALLGVGLFCLFLPVSLPLTILVISIAAVGWCVINNTLGSFYKHNVERFKDLENTDAWVEKKVLKRRIQKPVHQKTDVLTYIKK